MKPLKLKAMSRIYFVLFILLCSTSGIYAQIAVTDQMLIDEISEHTNKHIQQAALLESISKLHEQIKDTVEATLELQLRYQLHLRQTASTAFLTLFDMEKQAASVGEVENAASHLQDYDFAQSLARLYTAQLEPAEKSQLLYELLLPYDPYLDFDALSAFKADQQQRKLDLAALQEMSRWRRLQLFESARLFSQGSVEKARQMDVFLNRNELFSMSEQERLQLLRAMQAYYQSSLARSTQADELLQKVATHGFYKAQLIGEYERRLERKNLALTPIF
jgi:hypothetical protein